MMLALADPVRCVEGCGSGETVVYIGLVVALLSLGVALAAWRVSQHSLRIARSEHKVFLDRLNARAEFDLTLGVESPAVVDGVIETTEEQTSIRWSMGIENSGDRAADDALINFLIPASVAEGSVWVTQKGALVPDPDRRHGPLTTDEKFVASDGTEEEAHYLVKEVARVSLKGSRVAYAEGVVFTTHVGQEVCVPASFRVESDDLPDDVQDRREDLELIVRRVEETP